MKKLLSLLAVAALMPVAANAEVLQNVNLKGDIQTIASDVKHDEGSYVRGTSARVLAGLSADLVEDVTANVMFQYANIWGNNNATGQNVQGYWDSIRLAEANVVLHNLFCCLEATVGRQFYGDEDSAVIYFGPNHYNAEFNGYVSSVDAAKITYGDDVKALTLIGGRINGDVAGSNATNAIPGWHGGVPAAPSFDFFGADFRMNLSDNLKAQVYGYDFRDAFVGPDGNLDSDAGFYGAKLSLDAAVRLSAEYARNFGGDRLVKEHDATGQMVKVDAATDLEKVTVRGTFYYANENFFAFGNYTPGLLMGHLFGGQLNGYSLTEGVSLFNLGFDMKPAEKWTVSLDGFSFQDHRMKHSATYEADLTAKYAHNEYVELFAGVGYANYAKMLGADHRDNVKGQLGMLIKF
ncbi:hypothetical protein [Candidatus Avelusimicrobium caledoniensis]|uniref:hypothetical protein n=1 Tax=Candidatus Avelusimicrobium caledoniensis TaxID=3416220 RepID=UPI003D11D853